MKNYLYISIFILLSFFIVNSKTITTLDSAVIVSPKNYSNLLSDTVIYEILPKCSVNQVILYVKTSFDKTDTLAILNSSPYRATWNIKKLNDKDQLRLQFQYTIFHPNGDTIQSIATPHRWIKFSEIESNNKKAISRYLDHDEVLEIDGNLKEWKKVPANIISSNAYFKTRWSSSDFYFAIIVEDYKITPQDQVELSLDLMPDESPFFGINQRIFIFGPSRRSFVIAVNQTDKGPLQSDSILIRVGEEMEWRSKTNSDGYTIEIRIPFVLLSDLEFPPKTFGFDLTIIDSDGKEREIRSWSAQNPNTRQIKLNWGKIELKQNYFPLKLTLLIGLFTFILLIITSSIIGFLNKQISRKKIKKMALSATTQKILKAIEEKYSLKDFSISNIENEININREEIEDHLIREMGKDFPSVLTNIRVEKSKRPLLNGDIELDQIAQMCGFDSKNQFTNAFQKLMKTDPQTWREGRYDEDLEDEIEEES